MAGPLILAEREASQAKRDLLRARARREAVGSADEAEDRSFASPESLFLDQYEPLARAITLMTRDPDVAEDAVQEAFARLCREWPTVSGYRHQAGWVRTVAVNVARDQQRKQGRLARLFPGLEQDAPDPSAEELPAGGDPELWKAVRELPEKQRTAVGLFYIADLNIAEVSAAMGVSKGTVNRHLNRARSTLRKKMEAQPCRAAV